MVIQRSWKILSETASTSASSTEANRSPVGLQSFSDDSNCSNQTAHSLATSIASSPKMKLDVHVTTTESTTVQQIPAAPLAGMNVVVTSVNTTNTASADTTKYITTPHIAETMLQRLRQRLSFPVQVSGTGTTAESAMRSLELLRISIQQSFDHEVDVIIKQYMENYFKPAFQNIKENLGQNVVSEEILQKMSCALLENAKAQYNPYRNVKQQLECATASTASYSIPQYATGEATSLRFAVKRPPPRTADLTGLSAAKKLLTTTTQQHMQSATSNSAAAIATFPTASINANLNAATNMFQQQLLQITPQRQQQKTSVAVATTTATTATATTTARRQIFWNTAHISTTTKFVLDVQANQAFGFGTDGKERLASKHPELIRYLPDNEDRDWLSAQNIIAEQNRNSRFLFLIHEEVCRLKQMHEAYRNKSNIDLNIMHTFSVPEFMIQKMKLFFVDLNIKSRGLITNSFSVGVGAQGNSHLRNALLQGNVASSNTTTTSSNSSNISSVRATGTSNSLSAVSSATIAEITPLIKNSYSSNNNNNNTAATIGNCNIASSTSDASNLLKPSALSSSHATLTALLNNSTNQTSPDKSSTAKMHK